MNIIESFSPYLEKPQEEILEKEFQLAKEAASKLDPPLSPQSVLDGITPSSSHFAFSVKAGLFLSALLLPLNEAELTLPEDHMINFLSAFNKKSNLKIKGSAGSHFCSRMTGGEVVIDGNISDYGCEGMIGGKVTIKGLAESHLGYNMVGGEIIVSKNVYDFTGNQMCGGHIIVRASAGYSTGYRMVGGIIDIGDLVWDNAGEEMAGGRIKISGKIGAMPCLGMAGGEIGLQEGYKDSPKGKMSGGKVVYFAKGTQK